MRGLSVALLVLAGACSLFVGDDEAAIDAGTAIDGEPAAADAADCSTSNATLAVIDDTTIDVGSPDQSKGTNELANIGVGVGMFKFFLDPTVVALSADNVRGVRLDLPYAILEDSCSSNCGSCDDIDAPGEARVYVMRSDWDGSTVTYNDRIKSDQPWEAPGASGVADRSPLLDTALHMDNSDTSIEIDVTRFAENFEAWVFADHLTFQVAVDGATRMLVTTLEGTCPGRGATARLVVEFCQDP